MTRLRYKTEDVLSYKQNVYLNLGPLRGRFKETNNNYYFGIKEKPEKKCMLLNRITQKI